MKPTPQASRIVSRSRPIEPNRRRASRAADSGDIPCPINFSVSIAT